MFNLITQVDTDLYLNIIYFKMAKKQTEISAKLDVKISRPNIHSKSKTSSLKSSKNYQKKYKGQGR